MNISLDIYGYLLQFVNDETILNMLSVNKKFSNDTYFEKIMKEKYPLLIKFRKNEESWKCLFLQMTRSISKLEEKYNIPYIPAVEYNPHRFLKKYDRKDSNEIYSGAIKWAGETGDLNLINKLICPFDARGELDNNIQWTALIDLKMIACKFGHIEIVKLMTKRNIKYFPACLKIAAKYGHLPIVKLMLENDDSDINKALWLACHGGYLDIVEFLIENGATRINQALTWAEGARQLEIIHFLIKKGAQYGEKEVPVSTYNIRHEDM
jgi:ankyrin repeat protein